MWSLNLNSILQWFKTKMLKQKTVYVGLTFGFSVHVPHTSSAGLRGGCNANLAGARIAPSARAVRARPAARRPWRPLHLPRPAYHENGRRRTRGSLLCTGLSGYRRPRLGRTSRKPAAAFQGTCGTSDCRLLKMSCPRRRAEVCRNSSRITNPAAVCCAKIKRATCEIFRKNIEPLGSVQRSTPRADHALKWR